MEFPTHSFASFADHEVCLRMSRCGLLLLPLKTATFACLLRPTLLTGSFFIALAFTAGDFMVFILVHSRVKDRGICNPLVT